MRAFITILIIIGILVAGYFLFAKPKNQTYSTVTSFADCKTAGFPIMESYPERCTTPDGRVFTNTAQVGQNSGSTVTGKEDLIVAISPTPNQVVTSPLTITGRARGNWYFEASFPIELIDANGKQLAITPATAQGDWMTTEFVPFSAMLTFLKPTTATGTLILHKDNPSGLPEHDNELRVPVHFSAAEQTIKLYYYNPANDKDTQGTILCSNKGLIAVERTIPTTQTPIQDAIRLFLKGGLTTPERTRGITTEFPLQNVTLTGANLKDGILTLSLTDPLHKTNGGSCRVAVLRAQLEATAKQFPGVTSVRFIPNDLFQP